MLGSQWSSMSIGATASSALSTLRSLGTGSHFRPCYDVCSQPLGCVPLWLFAVGTDIAVTRQGTCAEWRYRISFRDLIDQGASLPLLLARFPAATTGYERQTYVTRVIEAHELLAPLPSSSLRVPVSLPLTTCAGYSVGAALHSRNFTAPVQLAVNGRVATCAAVGNPNCSAAFNTTQYPIVLSVIPNTGMDPLWLPQIELFAERVMCHLFFLCLCCVSPRPLQSVASREPHGDRDILLPQRHCSDRPHAVPRPVSSIARAAVSYRVQPSCKHRRQFERRSA